MQGVTVPAWFIMVEDGLTGGTALRARGISLASSGLLHLAAGMQTDHVNTGSGPTVPPQLRASGRDGRAITVILSA